MQIKSLLCAAALATLAAAAQAEDVAMNVALMPNASIPGSASAGVGVTHLLAGSFTDMLTFTGAMGGMVSGSLVTIGFVDSNDIDFTSVTLNGQAFTLRGADGLDLATLQNVDVSGPLVLTISGIAAPGLSAGTAIAASYAGTMNVSAVPEAQTSAMLLAGMGVLVLLGRRRLGA